MSAKELSILIPARNEIFLARTIQDILEHIEADTEIITVMDGDWADPGVPQNDRVNIIKLNKSIGQRAATNLACKLSKAKYVMKVDAHCSFEQGFDRKMLKAFQKTGDNVTMVPIMRNLWAFDWKCYHCGWKKYQGPTPKKCEQCGKSDRIKKKMIWKGKNNPQSKSYCFDSSPKFQYFNDWKRRKQYKNNRKEKGLTETMSLQGSCWMLTRKKYWELGVCDEKFGGWGSQGIEVACKTWLSGGRVLVNHKTWYAHMFRTQGGDFSFPYSISGKDQKKAQKYAKDLFFKNKWSKQIHPLSWLLEKFWPVKGWTDKDLKNIKKYDSRISNKDKQITKVDGDLKRVESIPDNILDYSEMNEDSNLVQILGGNKRIVLDIVDLSKNKNGDKKNGTFFSIDPSKSIIYYGDKDINLKILIEKIK
jgi:hypothetical protein